MSSGHNLRLHQRIDYKVLNKSGIIVPKSTFEPCSNASENDRLVNIPEIEGTMTSTMELESKFMSLVEEIEDYVDEHQTDDSLVVEDIDAWISKIENMRTELRDTNRSLKPVADDYDKKYLGIFTNSISMVKNYIHSANDRRGQIRQSQVDIQNEERTLHQRKYVEEKRQKTQEAEFLVNEVSRVMAELLDTYSKNNDDQVSDSEISTRNDRLAALSSKLDKLSSKYQRTLGLIPDEYTSKDVIIKQLSNTYDHIIKAKIVYEDELKNQVDTRELLKQKLFQASALNIKLQVFSGYASELDIYSFQSEFDKLYSKSTPMKMQADLLKHNYLTGTALSLVKSVEDINEIWVRLKKAYGDPKTMLDKKLAEVRRIGPLWKLKGSERIRDGLINIINAMSDLISLCKRHCIEGKLYNGDALNIIYSMMGDGRVTRWLTCICDENLEDEALWSKLIMFLEKELKVEQEKALIKKNYDNDRSMPTGRTLQGAHHTKTNRENMERFSGSADDQGSKEDKKCAFCDEVGHIQLPGPRGSTLVQYFSCQKFVEMAPAQRFRELRSKGLCFQCLYPGAHHSDARHNDGSCQRDFVCKHSSHNKYPCKKHVLVCHEHRDSEENKAILSDYKNKFILHSKVPLPDFAKDIKLSLHVHHSSIEIKSNISGVENDDDIINENGIYILQTIKIENEYFTLFFDSGCSDMVVRHSSIQRIGDRAKQEITGPIVIGGVGDLKSKSTYGVYQVRLPLHNGNNAVLSGVCLDKITSTFPIYPLQGQISDDISAAYMVIGGDVNDLPLLPKSIGGDVDIMIGSKYFRYHPEVVFTLPSGLTIYRSPFVNADGTRGVIGGPHQVITEIDKQNSKNCQYSRSFLNEQFRIYRMGYQVNPDNKLLNIKLAKDFNFNLAQELDDQITENYNACKSTNSTEDCTGFLTSRKQKLFEQVENAASEIIYRCVDCRNCSKCKHGEKIEMISIREEVEQDLINRSVCVDVTAGITTAKLPLLEDPVMKLTPNKNKALAVYHSQLKKLNKCEKDKMDVIESESKLQCLGHVEYVNNLTKDQQLNLLNNPVQNFIPWMCVWNSNSISTPCRLVFNASQPTQTSVSLNDILAKGRNNMNKLVEIMIRWMTHKVAFHTDVQKMYNAVKLVEEDWCLQRYIWQKDLDPGKIPEEKVIKTLIYGVKSSGNQAERGLRETANIYKTEYPEVNRIIQSDTYVDDCLSGENTSELAFQRADELTLVLRRGGFNLKGFTFSGKPPLEILSSDTKSINVAGLKWYPEKDQLQLDINELSFKKKNRGRKVTFSDDQGIPINLTRRHCVSKVSEIFDLLGKVTPITANLKLNLRTLIQHKLDWDDAIPDGLRPMWKSHFQMIQQLNNIKFNRAIVPVDAVNMDINTIDAGDASKSIACSAIYVRFLRKTGEYSCQLVFSRSKLLPEGITQPRAELCAATLNAHTGEIVKRSLGEFHKYALKITDSQIVLHWIHNSSLPLKQWTRNRVVEILRFTDPGQWKFVQSSDMIADIGTRPGASIADVSLGSTWLEGYQWMKYDHLRFPVKSYEDIKLSKSELSDVKSEMIIPHGTNEDLASLLSSHSKSTYFSWNSNTNGITIPDEVLERYTFSNYILDPNKHRFRTTVRIIAIVQKFIKACRTKTCRRYKPTDSKFVFISDEEFQEACNYFFRKATLEVKHFNKPEYYEKIGFEQDNILYYKGRILSNQTIPVVSSITDVMKDLTNTMFCVPLVDKFSPLSYSVVNEVHWYDQVAKHSGVETVLRYTLKYCYILEGRELVKRFRKTCIRCRLLAKRTIDVSMGPVSEYNLTIAPAFYITQTDVAGPFPSFSPHHKGSTVKIWLLVFCCATTSAVIIKVMEDYSTVSFIQGFIRFSCEVGYPKILLIDEGSQLVKGCEDMKLNYIDLQKRLHLEMNVEFETCPVGGHNMHGKVERKIRHIKECIEKSMQNERLSMLQWETLVSQIANSINDLPLAVGSVISDLENMDLITPNRLRLGRNNERGPVWPMIVSNNHDKFLRENQRIFESWFQAWLITHVPKLVDQPKWFNNTFDISEGDIVLFLKQEGKIVGSYQYGMIVKVYQGNDGKIRSVDVKYRNHTENTDRISHRAVRQLVMIHPVNELNIVNELGAIATAADMRLKVESEKDVD